MTLPYENATSGEKALGEIQKLLRGFGCTKFGSMCDDEAQTPEGALASSLGGDTDPDDDDGEGGTTDPGAAEQAELEAGMRDSIAAAKVKPKRGAAGVH